MHRMASQEKLERVVLQRRLLKVWLANHVDDSYQAIALPYFDRLSPKQANQALLDELKEHYEGVSGYYRLKETILQRENIIRGLSHRLSLLARSESTPTAEPELRQLCEFLGRYRKACLLLCEQFTRMIKKYEYNIAASANNYLALFASTSSDLAFLRQSLLRFYVSFSQGYDPLFLHHFRVAEQLYARKELMRDEAVEQLFSVSISYYYRLLRAHQQMLHYASSADTMNSVQITTGVQSGFVSFEAQVGDQMHPIELQNTVIKAELVSSLQTKTVNANTHSPSYSTENPQGELVQAEEIKPVAIVHRQIAGKKADESQAVVKEPRRSRGQQYFEQLPVHEIQVCSNCQAQASEVGKLAQLMAKQYKISLPKIHKYKSIFGLQSVEVPAGQYMSRSSHLFPPERFLVNGVIEYSNSRIVFELERLPHRQGHRSRVIDSAVAPVSGQLSEQNDCLCRQRYRSKKRTREEQKSQDPQMKKESRSRSVIAMAGQQWRLRKIGRRQNL